MNRITPEELADLRRRYLRDCRVKLICMNDPYSLDLKAGATGTVMHVDDVGTIHVAWDCGSTLGVVYGVDSCMVVHSESTWTPFHGSPGRSHLNFSFIRCLEK